MRSFLLSQALWLGYLQEKNISPCNNENLRTAVRRSDTFLLPYNWTEGLIAVFAGVLCTGLAAVFASYSLAHAKPAQIMRPQSPKPGKRVLAERIPFLWKRLSFNQKTTVRNMFRYKKRLFMTVIGVAGCMGLVLVGLGLHDSITVVADKQFEELTHYRATMSLSDSLSEQQRSQLIEDITQTRGVDVLAVYQKAVEVQGKDSTQTVTVVVPQSLQSIKSTSHSASVPTAKARNTVQAE